MCLAYGVLAGVGAGLAYNTILAVLLKWFPDRLGLAAGLMLMGIGFGSFFLSMGGARLLSYLSWREIFLLFGGVVFLFFMLVAGQVKPPPPGTLFPEPTGEADKAVESERDLTTRQMLRRPSFIFYFIWSVVICAAGLTLIGHASPLAQELGASPAVAGMAVGMISIANGLGRTVFGLVVDKTGRRLTLGLIGGSFLVCGLLLAICIQFDSLLVLYLLLALCGLCYGGAMPTGSSMIGTYGLKHYQMNLSVCVLGMFPASFLGPYLSGLLHSATNSYFSTAFLLLAFGTAGLLLAWLIKRP